MSESQVLSFIPQNVLVQMVLSHRHCCSDHMFYQSCVNIVVNMPGCKIITEILQFIGDYIYSSWPVFYSSWPVFYSSWPVFYSSWPVFSISFLPSMSFFQQARNFEINNSTFINMPGGTRSGKKDSKNYDYYREKLPNAFTYRSRYIVQSQYSCRRLRLVWNRFIQVQLPRRDSNPPHWRHNCLDNS